MKDNALFRWEFGTCNFIVIYKDNIACAHFSYNAKLKVQVSWSTGYLSRDDWEQVLTCIKEAKDILKKVSKI